MQFLIVVLRQAARFGTVFEQDLVLEVNIRSRPFTVKTNETTIRSNRFAPVISLAQNSQILLFAECTSVSVQCLEIGCFQPHSGDRCRFSLAGCSWGVGTSWRWCLFVCNMRRVFVHKIFLFCCMNNML